jgi:uncharacterized protein YdaU (DUF1376 family)
MHYYQHHIGDFIKDTANLNDHQLATYLRMIWAYYDAEKPFNDELEDIAFAMRSDEKTVRLLLKHYFTETEKGWVHTRCDKEIAVFKGKSEKAKQSAKSRWTNANAQNKDANAQNKDANQEPRTNNQEPVNKTHTGDDCNSFEITKIASVCISIKREFDLQNKQCFDIQQSHPTLNALIEAGETPQEFADAARVSAQKGKGFGYLLGMVKRQREDAANLTLHQGAMPSTKSTYEQGIQSAASSIFTPENTAHLNKFTTLEADYEQRAIAG